MSAYSMIRMGGRLASGLAGLLLLAGCGMEAVDTQMRTRGEVGVPDERTLAVVQVEYVCPHLVPINQRPFSEQDVARGEVDGVFGPFVPCGTVLPEGATKCTGDGCGQPVKTPGQSGEAPVCTVKFACPYCKTQLDPGAVQVRGKDPKVPHRFARNQCTNDKCGRYFEAAPTDLLTTIGVHEEVVCPSCLKPFDPSLNACTNAGCKLAGATVRLTETIEGPCWRCAGQAICPACSGSGAGTLAVYGDTPTDCWSCGQTGRCPDCDGSGFTTYVGGLPPKFSVHKGQGPNAQAVESSARGWQHTPDDAAPASDEETPPGE